jgi:hypothetical protein
MRYLTNFYKFLFARVRQGDVLLTAYSGFDPRTLRCFFFTKAIKTNTFFLQRTCGLSLSLLSI